MADEREAAESESADRRSVASIVDRARDLLGAERTAFIDGACDGDPSLRDRVERALALEVDATAVLHPTPVRTSSRSGRDGDAAPGNAAPTLERAGDVIGRYRLLQQVGEGGFGSVWMAEQREPVKRRVALKIIKLGMDTRQVIARFEAERQALAMMDHPNIARVYDAGATETGRPFFVMELVRGVPITEYCDNDRLDLRARLRLLIDVCHAIQHAHQKGIIHRDIKPSNVLVTLHDGVAMPKVIDFGIAKATNADLTERTLVTEQRQLVGTPAYMAPEQAEVSGLDVDTRADVYSLGVLLYELLTGTTPFDPKRMEQAGFADLMRMITEAEPRKPSTRIDTIETLERVASDRRIEPKRLGVFVRGDLDWIVMKCLEKDRTRRYDTANALADDIGRFLADEPVSAGPPTTTYRLRKFVRRNRVGVIAGTFVTIALVLAVVGTSVGLISAVRQSNRADAAAELARAAAAEENAAKILAMRSADDARIAARRAENEATRATEVKAMVADMLTSVRPEEAQGLDNTLMLQILDGTITRLDDEPPSDPLIEAELRVIIGESLSLIAEFERAEPQLRRAVTIRREQLGSDDPATIDALESLAEHMLNRGRFDAAEPYCREILDSRVAMYGESDLRTLGALNNLGVAVGRQGRLAEAEELLLRALEGKREHPEVEPRDLAESIINMGSLMYVQRKLEEAERYFREGYDLVSAELGSNHPLMLSASSNLGTLLHSRGRLDEAEPFQQEALERSRRILGEDHPSTLNTMVNIASRLRAQGRIEDALAMSADAVERSRRVFGDANNGTLNAMNGMARLLAEEGRWEEAADMYRDVLAGRRVVLGDDHPRTFSAMNSLAGACERLDRTTEALALRREMVASANRVLGPAHPDARVYSRRYADLLEFVDRFAEAEPLRRAAVAATRAEDPVSPLQLALELSLHGLNLLELERFSEAEATFAEALDLRTVSLGAGNWRTCVTRSLLGSALQEQGRVAEAAPLIFDAARRINPPAEDLESASAALRATLERAAMLADRMAADDPDSGLAGEAVAWRARIAEIDD